MFGWLASEGEPARVESVEREEGRSIGSALRVFTWIGSLRWPTASLRNKSPDSHRGPQPASRLEVRARGFIAGGPRGAIKKWRRPGRRRRRRPIEPSKRRQCDMVGALNYAGPSMQRTRKQTKFTCCCGSGNVCRLVATSAPPPPTSNISSGPN